MDKEASHTYSTVHISFGPHSVVLVIDDFRSTHDMKIPHHIFLNVSQCGNLTKISYKETWETKLRNMDSNEQSSSVTQAVKHDIAPCGKNILKFLKISKMTIVLYLKSRF